MNDAPETGAIPPQKATAEAAWDAYWRHGGAPGHALADTAKGEVLDHFWSEALASAFAAHTPRKVADLACGGGAVAALVAKYASSAGRAPDALLCVDWSAVAASAAARRLAGAARPVAADLAALPLAAGALDLVVSQYGLEYAGESAFLEAARVLAPGGAFIALVHDSEGGVAAECRLTHWLFEEAVECSVIASARAVFAAGFEADHAPDRQERQTELANAERRLHPAMKRFEALVARQNDTTAMQFLRQVHRDLRIMLARRRAYAPQDVLDWLGKIENEMTTYQDRMASMLKAARSAPQIDEIAAIFRKAGCVVEPPRRVFAGPGGASIGWAVGARRARDTSPA